MGFLNYYRIYRNFSKIAKPIYDLVKPTQLVPKQQRNIPKTTKKHSEKQWVNPDPNSPYVLHTDVSETGLGAVLYQEQHGILQVIAYGSRTLMPVEKNYHLHSGKLEFFAVRWVICEQFRDYLYYSPSFVVYTDNNPLTHVLSSAKVNATDLRWIGELVDFNFTIRYHPGKTNTDADTLSRMPELMCEYMTSCTEETSQDELYAIIQSTKEQDQGRVNWTSSITYDPNVLSESEPKPSTNGST